MINTPTPETEDVLTEEELQNAERYNAAGRFALKDVSYPPPYDRRNELLVKLIAAARKGIEAQKLVSDIRQIIQCAGAIRGDIEDRLNVYSPPQAPTEREEQCSIRAERDRLQREVERLACLVKRAYNEGFLEGMDEVKRDRGGKSWGESKSRTALIGEG